MDLTREELEKGVVCGCCGQFAKLYTRKLNTGQAYSLIRVARSFRNSQWVHVENFSKSNSKAAEFSKLRFWGLVESKGDFKLDGNSSGLWRVTNKGYDFVDRVILVPAKVQIYNNEWWGFSNEQTDIVKALGKNFNYNEMMHDRI